MRFDNTVVATDINKVITFRSTLSHLFRNDGEYFNVDPVEFVKAGPSPCLN